MLRSFSHPCYAQLRTTTHTKSHFKNLELRFACQNLKNKLIAKNPNIKVSPSVYATESKLVYAGVWIEYIIDKDTLDALIDDMKNGKLDYDFNQYRIYDSLFS